MSQKSGKQAAPPPAAANDAELAPITVMMSSRLMVLANLLKRGAILRYKRLAGLSSVEFGLVASLGRRPRCLPDLREHRRSFHRHAPYLALFAGSSPPPVLRKDRHRHGGFAHRSG